MTPAEVAQALHDRFPGRANALPTPMKRGTAVAIQVGPELALGTIAGSYSTGSGFGEATAFVILNTGVRVEIPWTWLRIPPHSN